MDPIRVGFLERQHEAALDLQAASDLVTFMPLPGSPPDRYLVELHCQGLVRTPAGAIVVADRFVVGVYFPEDYLRAVPNPFQCLTMLHPEGVFHPNIATRGPFICAGHVPPGTGLVELTYTLWELITYRKYTLTDALNDDACQWARQNSDRFPIDRRPLKPRALDFALEKIVEAS